MWIIKEFKSRKAMDKFIGRNHSKIEWVEVFVNNAFCIEYRKLRVINFD